MPPLHQALVGDRLRLPLDAALCRAVTGHDAPLAHPNLVCDVAIGQSTGPTQRVRGNLFYRGLVLLRPVFIGDTLRTRTEVVGLKQNRPRHDGTATGLVALRIQTRNQHGEPVLDFWRCPMIPLRDPATRTGHADRFDDIPRELDLSAVARRRCRATGSYDAHAGAGGRRALRRRSRPGTAYRIEGRDTVTAAPELARLTLNVARAHTDAGGSVHGRRLAYGGHTISIAAAQVTRALPEPGHDRRLARLRPHRARVRGRRAEHRAHASRAMHPLEVDGAGLVDLRALVHAEREGEADPEPVLDWRFVGVLADPGLMA